MWWSLNEQINWKEWHSSYERNTAKEAKTFQINYPSKCKHSDATGCVGGCVVCTVFTERIPLVAYAFDFAGCLQSNPSNGEILQQREIANRFECSKIEQVVAFRLCAAFACSSHVLTTERINVRWRLPSCCHCCRFALTGNERQVILFQNKILRNTKHFYEIECEALPRYRAPYGMNEGKQRSE